MNGPASFLPVFLVNLKLGGALLVRPGTVALPLFAMVFTKNLLPFGRTLWPPCCVGFCRLQFYMSGCTIYLSNFTACPFLQC